MHTQIFNLTQAKANLSAVLDLIEKGEEVIITRMGKPVARVVKAEPKKERSFIGLYEGQGWMAPDFDEWPEEEARALGIID